MPLSLQKPHDVFAVIEEFDRMHSPDRVLDTVKEVVAGYGFDKLLFAGLRPSAEQSFSDVVLISGWRSDFLHHYIEQEYVRFDPVARRARGSLSPFEWDGETAFAEGDQRGTEVMRCAAEFGIARGLIVPIHGPNGYDACVSMSGDSIDLPMHLMPALHLMALYSFERIRSLLGQSSTARPLSNREQEVLAWVAEGKSAWEIGEILSIAPRTVEWHMTNASRKLGTANRVHAVAVALREGIISI
jgi:LuxR family quorum sensing-dependent transcriptional regulator